MKLLPSNGLWLFYWVYWKDYMYFLILRDQMGWDERAILGRGLLLKSEEGDGLD